VRASLQIGPKISPDGQTVLEQFIFSCRLDRDHGDAPVSVSLVAPHNFRLSNLLPVEVPERPERPIEFGQCMSIVYWQQDPFRLVEWLEAQRLWGVGEVNVYATVVDNVTDSILRRYATDTDGFLTYRQSPGIRHVLGSQCDSFLFHQLPHLSVVCLSRVRSRKLREIDVTTYIHSYSANTHRHQ